MMVRSYFPDVRKTWPGCHSAWAVPFCAHLRGQFTNFSFDSPSHDLNASGMESFFVHSFTIVELLLGCRLRQISFDRSLQAGVSHFTSIWSILWQAHDLALIANVRCVRTGIVTSHKQNKVLGGHTVIYLSHLIRKSEKIFLVIPPTMTLQCTRPIMG